MEKLAAIFPETMHYYMGKVFEGIDRLNYAEMGVIHLDLIRQIFEDFQAALEQRGLELDTYDSVKYLYEEIAYPLLELRTFFEQVKNGEEPILRPEAARIFAWFLIGKLDELRGIAKEIDEDYAK